MKRGRLLLIIGVSLLGLLLAAVLLTRPSDAEMITVRLVDSQTSQPITNVTVTCHQQWTTLPLHRLRLPFLKAWRSKTSQCGDTFEARIPTKYLSVYFQFNSPGYFPGFLGHSPAGYSLDPDSDEPYGNEFIIALIPRAPGITAVKRKQ